MTRAALGEGDRVVDVWARARLVEKIRWTRRLQEREILGLDGTLLSEHLRLAIALTDAKLAVVEQLIRPAQWLVVRLGILR